jgi:uncharacterized membrane protein YphA (DoxX/SURF4 family)
MEVTMKRFGRLVNWTLAVVLAVFFVAVGVAKIGSPGWETRFAAWGYPPWSTLVVAVVEAAAGVGLLVPASRRAAGGVLMIVMLGATLTHAVHAEWPRTIVTTVLLALLAVVLATSRVGSRGTEAGG